MTMRDALISFPMFGEGFVINPPAYFEIGSFKVYLYGIVIALGFLLAVLYANKYSERFGIKMDEVYDLLIWAVVAAIIGARLYYVIFYWELYADDLVSILYIRDGGLAIYGGVIGAALAIIIRCRVKKRSMGRPFDIMALGLLVGQLVGRWGNFFNREAFGYETDVFCRMGLTLNGVTTYVHPTFLYESLWNLLGFLFLHFYSKNHRRYEGQFFIMYLFWYGLGRMFIEGLRTDSLWLVPGVIRVSQLLALVTMAGGLAIYIINAVRMRNGRGPLLGKALDGDDIIDKKESAPDTGAKNGARETDNSESSNDNSSSGDGGKSV